MNETVCSREVSVLRALRTGHWSTELRTHVKACEECAEVIDVSRWMGTVRHQLSETTAPLPSPDIVWLKAQMDQRQRLEKQRILPALVGRAIARIAVGPVFAIAALRVWPAVDSLVGRLGETSGQLVRVTVANPAVYMTAPVLVVVATMVIIIAFRPSLRGTFFP